jgi:hypothetical protein
VNVNVRRFSFLLTIIESSESRKRAGGRMAWFQHFRCARASRTTPICCTRPFHVGVDVDAHVCVVVLEGPALDNWTLIWRSHAGQRWLFLRKCFVA